MILKLTFYFFFILEVLLQLVQPFTHCKIIGKILHLKSKSYSKIITTTTWPHLWYTLSTEVFSKRGMILQLYFLIQLKARLSFYSKIRPRAKS